MSIQERGKGGENGEVESEQTLENLFLTARFLWKEPLTSSPMQEGGESLGQRGTGMGSGHKADQAASEQTEGQTTTQGRGGGQKERWGGTDIY